MYSTLLLDHFGNPRNVGDLGGDAGAVVADVENPACGDRMRLSCRFEAGRVAAVRYQAKGCAASIAAGSAMTEWMTGKSIAELSLMKAADVEAAVGGLEPASKHAAILCVDAVKRLLAVAKSAV